MKEEKVSPRKGSMRNLTSIYCSLRDITKERWFKVDMLAILAGLAGGIGAIVFRGMIAINQKIFFGTILPEISLFAGNHNLSLILLPALGGLIIGPIIYKVSPETKGHGVPEVMEALSLRGGRIRTRVAFVKIIVSSITIGSGGSAGREGPIAQIGSSVGSIIAQRYKLTERDVRLLVVCGAASGIAATFNAPLGGVLFGLEVLHRRIEPLDAIPILLASVIGTSVAISVLGPNPSLVVPPFPFPRVQELGLYLIFGLIFGLISFIWVKIFYLVEDFFDEIKFIPPQYRLAVGGIFVGIFGIISMSIIGINYGGTNNPEIMRLINDNIMGVGYGGMELAIAGGLPLALLLVLGLLKICSTSFTIGSGGSGGIFAPSLYIGSMLGGAMGLTFHNLFPHLVKTPTAYCLVGMGALFAGAASAPLTCIIFIPEMAKNFNLFLPLMLACSTSYAVSHVLLKGSSIYTLKFERRGVKIREEWAPTLEKIKVEDAMNTNLITVSQNRCLADLHDIMLEKHHLGYPVVDGNRLVGIITFDDLIKIPLERRDKVLISEIMSKNLIVTYPDESLQKALDKLHKNDIGRLPVVDRKNPDKLIGIITRSDILRALEIAVSREREMH
ncbi:MAG: chloride channel protein [Candidatus Hydrothermarchaeota archaeon]